VKWAAAESAVRGWDGIFRSGAKGERDFYLNFVFFDEALLDGNCILQIKYNITVLLPQ